MPARATVPGQFKQYNMEAGGWLTGMVQHAGSGRIYARTDVGGAYLTDDAGENWIYLSGSMTNKASLYVHGIAVENRDVDTVYQACGVSYFGAESGRGIWKTSNAGSPARAWTQVLSGVNFSGNDAERHGGECLLIHPGNEDEVWAGSRGQGLWRSPDAGAGWSKVGGTTFDGVNLCGVHARAEFPDQIWAYGSGGAWLSTDHGATWTKLITAEIVYRVTRKADGKTFAVGGKLNPTAESDTKLWVITAGDWANPATYSTNDVWANYLSAHQSEFGWKPTNNAACLTVLNDGRLVTAPFFSNAAISSDDGGTFTIIPRLATAGPLPAWQVVGSNKLVGGFNQLLEDATQANRWFLTGGYGPARSDNGGTSWKYVLNGIGQVVSWKVLFHETDPDKIFFPNADHGLSVVTDGGQSGNSAGFIDPHFPWPDDNVLFAHAALGSGSRIIAPGGEAGGQQGRIYVSEDNGSTWARRTPNGWTATSGQPWIGGIAAKDNADELILLMGGNTGPGAGGLYRSIDAGISFTQVTLPGAANGKWAGDEFTTTMWIHRDGGGTNRRYFLQRWHGLYRSDDRGQTWAAVSASGLGSGPSSWFDGIIATDDAIANNLWLGAVNGLWRSTDGGDNWTSVSDFTRVDQLDAHSGNMAVWGRRAADTWDKIYFSSDDGATWEEVTRPETQFPQVLGLSMDPYREGTIWIGQGGRSVSRFSPFTELESWRDSHFGSPDNIGDGADDSDPDGDGWKNLIEYALGSDPDDVANKPTYEIIPNGNKYQLRFDRVKKSGLVYGGVASRNLVDWDLPVTVSEDTAERFTIEGPANEPSLFYRLSVSVGP